jgi:hypothetical protein
VLTDRRRWLPWTSTGVIYLHGPVFTLSCLKCPHSTINGGGGLDFYPSATQRLRIFTLCLLLPVVRTNGKPSRLELDSSILPILDGGFVDVPPMYTTTGTHALVPEVPHLGEKDVVMYHARRPWSREMAISNLFTRRLLTKDKSLHFPPGLFQRANVIPFCLTYGGFGGPWARASGGVEGEMSSKSSGRCKLPARQRGRGQRVFLLLPSVTIGFPETSFRVGRLTFPGIFLSNMAKEDVPPIPGSCRILWLTRECDSKMPILQILTVIFCQAPWAGQVACGPH